MQRERSEYQKQYREQNKERLAAKRRERYIAEHGHPPKARGRPAGPIGPVGSYKEKWLAEHLAKSAAEKP